MTTKTIRIIAFIVLLVHGIGHLQGVVAALGVKINNSVPASSWLLKDLNEKAVREICFLLFLVTGIIAILAALSFYGILLSGNNWETLTLVAAFLSTICLLLFWNCFAMLFNKIGAIAVNLIIYYSILLNQEWPSGLFDN